MRMRFAIQRNGFFFRHGRSAAYLEEGSHHKSWSWDIYQRAQLARALGQNAGADNSLQNSDGGFGDRPGWSSRLYST
jgi:hypothetical protein